MIDKFEYFLFDLDGTLTDPKEGITKCFRYALKHFGVEVKDLDELLPVIGPPLVDSFKEFYGFDDDKAKKAVKKYRERFAEVGIYENSVPPWTAEVLAELKNCGKTVALATSKPRVFAERILSYYDIDKYFDVVVGSELDGTLDDKADVIAEVMRRIGDADKSKYLMIGDRKYDIIGAKKNGIKAMGVRYGYAAKDELEAAGADYIEDDIRGVYLSKNC